MATETVRAGQGRQAAPPLSKRMLTALALSVLVGAGVYLGGALLADAEAVYEKAGNITIACWLSLLGLSLFNYALRFLRWSRFIAHLGGSVPPWRHFLVYIAGFSLTTTPGKAGEAIRSLYLVRYGVPLRNCVAALFAERLMDMISVTAMAVFAVSLVSSAPTVFAVAAALVIGATAVMASPLPQLVAAGARVRTTVPWIVSLSGKLEGLFASSRQLMGPRPFLLGNAIGLVAWGAEGFGLYLLTANLGADLPLSLVLGIYGAAVLVGALSFLPGGIGSTEAAMSAMFVAAGVDLSTAVLATIVCRLVTLWFAVVLGLLAMLVVGGMNHELRT